MSDTARFWSRVDKTETCWLWTGAATNKYGHSQVQFDGRNVYVHRLSYELLVGPIPKGLVLDHLCRNARCVNPEHLEPVTLGENTRRIVRAVRTHCKRGHALEGDNVVFETHGGRTSRRCRECRRLAANTTGRRRDEPFTHCRRGHALTPGNVYMHPDGSGRECLTCVGLRSRNRKTTSIAAQLGAA